MQKQPNDLINESSPYLLQHAYNPVQWKSWSEETLALAKEEQKIILISIGYSACHWCHVMERECFEDETVAKIMNDNFINIKVDREERPDIDQVYMLAVQLMTGRGGWPLNCFALPDGRPFYGGTYFPKEQWKNVLLNIAGLWMHEKEKVFDYADKLIEGMKISEIAKPSEESLGSFEELEKTVKDWMKRSDHYYGGPDRAPKFPLPVNYSLLLHYNHYKKDKEIDKHIRLTLDKMASGGIYDQIGGGFARYSTDVYWKVPHFEKMLYDNAQLVSLYSKAYLIYKDSRYKDVVVQTLEFIRREFTGKDGEFYSALDADSEHEEGKFYVWTEEELKSLLTDDFSFFSEVYDLSERGIWEDGKIILMRKKNDLSETEEEHLKTLHNKLLSIRDKRVRPGLDDKALTSWNAMMITGLLDAYIATGKEEYLESAEKNYRFITQKMLTEDGRLLHSFRNGRSAIDAFLEDHAFLISALLKLYQCTFKEQYLDEAKSFTKTVLDEFYDHDSGTFFFTSASTSKLVVRKPEINDNVIPSSGAVMAHNLFTLGHLFEIDEYLAIAEKLALTFKPMVLDYPEGYAHWGELLLNFIQPYYEIAIAGDNSVNTAHQLARQIYPEKVIMGVKSGSKLPLTKGKPVTSSTSIYICSGRVCGAPVDSVGAALTSLV